MEPAGSGIEKLVASSLQQAPAGAGPVLAWPIACGASVAARTEAVEFQNGLLQVKVPDAGWRTELRSLAPRYVAILNRYSKEKVERIEFVIAPRAERAPSMPK